MLINNPIENIMNSTLNNLKRLTDIDTVIGKPITLPDNSILVPVSKVSVGYVVGGGEYSETNPKKDCGFPYATGSGAGVTVTPIGFLHAGVHGSSFIKTTESQDKLGDLISATINSIKKKGKNE